jgi:hypothetical protein
MGRCLRQADLSGLAFVTEEKRSTTDEVYSQMPTNRNRPKSWKMNYLRIPTGKKIPPGGFA